MHIRTNSKRIRYNFPPELLIAYPQNKWVPLTNLVLEEFQLFVDLPIRVFAHLVCSLYCISKTYLG